MLCPTRLCFGPTIILRLYNTIGDNYSKFSDFIHDSQLYKSVSPNIEEDQLTAISQL